MTLARICSSLNIETASSTVCAFMCENFFTLCYSLIFPSAFFLAVVYTEGLFLGLAFSSLLLLRRGHRGWAAVLAILATYTRAVGVALVVPLLMSWIKEGEWLELDMEWRQIYFKGLPWKVIWHAFVVFSPLLAFVLWRFSYFGMAFSRVEEEFFGRGLLSLGYTYVAWSEALKSLLLTFALLGLFATAVLGMAIPALELSNQQLKMTPTSDILLSQTEENTPTRASLPMPTSTPYIDENGIVMVEVLGSFFIMGESADVGLKECQSNLLICDNLISYYSDEEPRHGVQLPTFYIDKYEVTNSSYQECVYEGFCSPPKTTSLGGVGYFGEPEFGNYPVVYVDWFMARKFCEWRGARLPTEAEWEKTARGTNGQIYPWGNTFNCEYGNFDDETEFNDEMVIGGPSCDNYIYTAPVGSYQNGISPFGLFDMSGNVWEWVNSKYKPYPYDASDGREDQTLVDLRVAKGGGWTVNYVPRISGRMWLEPTFYDGYIGFRCAKDAP